MHHLYRRPDWHPRQRRRSSAPTTPVLAGFTTRPFTQNTGTPRSGETIAWLIVLRLTDMSTVMVVQNAVLDGSGQRLMQHAGMTAGQQYVLFSCDADGSGGGGPTVYTAA